MSVDEYLTQIRDVAERHGLDPALVAAIVEVESGGDDKALGDPNRDGSPYSFGLMQLHIKGAGFGHRPRLLLNPRYNLEVGCAYLRLCLDAFPESEGLGISAYNQGIAGARERGLINSAYVTAVLGARERWATVLGTRPPVAPREAVPVSPPLPAPPRRSYRAHRRYRVQPGDNLTKIAQEQYGIDDPRGAYLQGLAIWRANRMAIGPDPDKIRPGMELVLP